MEDNIYYTLLREKDPKTEEDVITPAMFEAFYLRGENRDRFSIYSTNFTLDDMGVWEEDDQTILEFMNLTTTFRIKYLVEHKLPSEHLFINDCFRWEITQDFDFFYRNHVVQRFKFSTFPCQFENSQSTFMTRYTWLHIISIVISLI